MKNELQELFQLAAKFFIKRYKNEGGSQSILAKELGITQSYLSSVTSGSRTASLELYNQIAAKLYGPLDKFLAVGRRIMEGREPLGEKEKPPEDPVENLIARLTYYVVDHQRIEKELSELKHFYETIVENQQTGVLVMNKNHTVIFANERMHTMAHIPAETIIGTTPYNAAEKIPGLDISSFREEYNESFARREPITFKNIKTKMPDGARIFISGSFSPQFKESMFDGMICSLYDTTTSHILRNLLLQTLNHSSHGIAVMQQAEPGKLPDIYYVNKQFRNMIGLDEIDPSQELFSELLDKIEQKVKNHKTWRNFINQSIGSNMTNVQFTMNLKSGKTLEWVCTPLIDDEGLHWGRIATVKENPRKSGRKK